MKKIVWGIIGCGNVTEVKSGPAFNRIENSSLRAVTRRTPGKARDYAKRHNVPKWYDDAGKLLQDPEINAVYIATPPDSHAKYAVMAAEAGKHIYVEKPMALNHAECLQMMEAAQRKNVSLFVAYYRRCLPSFLKVKQWLDTGAIGMPRCVNIRLFKPVHQLQPGQPTPWRFLPEISGGGLLVDLGSHQLDYLDYIFGPIHSIQSFAANQAGLYPAEDIVSASFIFKNGVLGTASWCFSAAKECRTDQIEILGSEGRIAFSTFDFSPIQLESSTASETLEFPKPAHVQEHFIGRVVEQLTGGRPCPGTGTSAARTNKVMDHILAGYKRESKELS